MENNMIPSGDIRSVNFREVCMGNIAPGILFRSSHPIKDNQQEKTLALLASQVGIASVINLADNDSHLPSKAFFAPWYNKLYQNKRITAVGMDFSFACDSFKRKLKKALQGIIHSEGPWLIHCYAGIDRTGIVAIVLESLMGASIDEITGDYVQSFNSAFESIVFTGANKNDVRVVMQLLSIMDETAVFDDHNVQGIAEKYLEHTIGLSIEEIELLKNKLSGS